MICSSFDRRNFVQNSLNDFRSALFAGDFYLAENIGLVQIQQNGEKPDWLNELGILYLMKGDLPEALRFFDRAVVSDANFIEAQFNAAIILSDLGFYEEASSRFAEACKREGVLLAQKHYDMSLFYQSVRRLPEAEEELKKAIAMYRSIDYLLELARVYCEMQKHENALEQILFALAMEPTNTAALNLQTQCLQSKENFISNPPSSNELENKILV
jgi:tetratricopeptide (TPR) repeat protein